MHKYSTSEKVIGFDWNHYYKLKLIDQINTYIKNTATSLGYTVVDVADAFEAYTGTEPLVGFNMAATTATYDPHPTDAGHRMIYDLLVAASTTVKRPRK